VAFTVWLPACAGAVYKPLALIVPALELPPWTLSTDQVMAVFVVPLTVAVNCAVAPGETDAEEGDTKTVTDPDVVVTVTWALAVLVGSATLVAITVCLPACAGAVYRPLVVIVPAVALPPTTVSTDQVTEALVVPCTVALNCMVPAAATVIEV
jgi:hypothetical protein